MEKPRKMVKHIVINQVYIMLGKQIIMADMNSNEILTVASHVYSVSLLKKVFLGWFLVSGW